MKPINLLLILVLLPFIGMAQVSEDTELYNEIYTADFEFFKAYNECDLATLDKYISEDLEFYHDQGGLSTSKADILKSLETNICNKVKRTLTTGTFEVHEIKDYGAVAMGKHSFHNLVEDSHSEPSKFVTIFKKTAQGWKITRVISLH